MELHQISISQPASPYTKLTTTRFQTSLIHAELEERLHGKNLITSSVKYESLYRKILAKEKNIHAGNHSVSFNQPTFNQHMVRMAEKILSFKNAKLEIATTLR